MDRNQKLCELMMWEVYEGETFDGVIARLEIKSQDMPPDDLIDVVHADGLSGWALCQKFESLEALNKAILRIFKIGVRSDINNNKDMRALYPPIYNFCCYANRIDRMGKMESEATKIAESAWYGELARIRLKEKTDEIFNVAPDLSKYESTVTRIMDIWGFDRKQIDAFRYFVCQTRQEDHNPSLNKSLYLSAKNKKTGKTTIARAIVAVLNGEKSIRDAEQFESTFNKEMQINDHDLPLAAQYNAVILDEAMPRDSRKTYGRVKSMLTSSTCSYNQKFGAISTIKVKRFYIYTSNDDISDFVQDDSERRFIQITMERIPKQIKFEEIYEIWKEFAQNCIPEENWQEWYDSFKDVDGVQRKDISYYKDEILYNPEIINVLKNMTGYKLSLKKLSDMLITGKSTRDERNVIKYAIIEMCGEPNGFSWNRLNLIKSIEDHIEEQRAQDIKDEIATEAEVDDVDNQLPF